MVIVDGNNVMGQRVGWHRNKPAARKRLIQEVEAIARSQNEPYVLFFDAASGSAVPDMESCPLLSVRYARPGSSADELILEFVYRHVRRTELVAVTSDRALSRQIRALGAPVMRSGAFRKMLQRQ
ncbi:MAG: NYN domain-containing protein [Acidobacteria bacterium]|nr:NYN domain-containing protein [Acidobacteriota bacterium]